MINFRIHSQQQCQILAKMAYVSRLNQFGYVLNNNKFKKIIK
jgi:hypothetical protein